MGKVKKYWTLFRSCFMISSFTFGGGFVIIPMMRRRFVTDLKWLEEREMMDLTAIAQSAPGAIAVNAAILLGFKIAGMAGALLAMLATILPPMLILSVISFFYTMFRENVVVNAVLSGMQAGVAAIICDVVLTMATEVCGKKNVLSLLVMSAAFILTFFVKVNVVYIICGCILLGILIFLFRRRRSASRPPAPTPESPSEALSKTPLLQEDTPAAPAEKEEEDDEISRETAMPEGENAEISRETETPESDDDGAGGREE